MQTKLGDLLVDGKIDSKRGKFFWRLSQVDFVYC